MADMTPADAQLEKDRALAAIVLRNEMIRNQEAIKQGQIRAGVRNKDGSYKKKRKKR